MFLFLFGVFVFVVFLQLLKQTEGGRTAGRKEGEKKAISDKIR